MTIIHRTCAVGLCIGLCASLACALPAAGDSPESAGSSESALNVIGPGPNPAPHPQPVICLQPTIRTAYPHDFVSFTGCGFAPGGDVIVLSISQQAGSRDYFKHITADGTGGIAFSIDETCWADEFVWAYDNASLAAGSPSNVIAVTSLFGTCG
jgi:hypothetical protein